MQITYRKAIIILDRLVTTERIEDDREELREAVKVAQKALNIVADLPPNHGRLIDADELLKNQAVIADKEFIHLLYRGTLRKMINKAATIIEAEVRE